MSLRRIALICTVVLALAISAEARTFYFVGLTGGGNALDGAADGTYTFTNNDFAIGRDTDGILYLYYYDTTSSAAENPPNVIAPNDAGGAGRWLLASIENSSDVTAAAVGGVSDNLDDSDASVEWEDAADLESDGSLSADVVDSAEIADGAVDAIHLNTTLDLSSFTLSLPPISSTDWVDDTDLDFGTGSNQISASDMPNEDIGDLSISGGSYTLDADVVSTAEMADADHGDFTYSSGSATLDADVVDSAEIADGAVDAIHLNTTLDLSSFTLSLPPISSTDWVDDTDLDFGTGSNQISASDMPNEDIGDLSISGGSYTLDADVVSTAEMADANHGDGAWSGGVLTVQNQTSNGDPGDGNYTGLIITGIDAGEDIDMYEVVYYDNDETEWMLADADAAGKWPAWGISVSSGTVSNGSALVVLVKGTIERTAWDWTPEAQLYLDDTTAGAIVENCAR
jgi:predicted RecA/RadA family phage recombinase